MNLDSKKIHGALKHVHANERTSTNPNGGERAMLAKQAVSDFSLNDAETDILLNALHVQRSEIGRAP
jgi:hypothetical protein